MQHKLEIVQFFVDCQCTIQDGENMRLKDFVIHLNSFTLKYCDLDIYTRTKHLPVYPETFPVPSSGTTLVTPSSYRLADN